MGNHFVLDVLDLLLLPANREEVVDQLLPFLALVHIIIALV